MFAIFELEMYLLIGPWYFEGRLVMLVQDIA